MNGVRRLALIYVLVCGLLLFTFAALPVSAAPAAGTAPAGRLESEFTHLILTWQDGAVRVISFLQFKNEGAGDSGAVALSLPAGYRLVSTSPAELAQRIKAEPSGLRDPEGIPAGGRREYRITYDVPLTESGGHLPVSIDYPTRELYVLADAQTLTMLPVQNRDVQSLGQTQLGQRRFDQYRRGDIAANSKLDLVLGPALATAAGGAGAERGAAGAGAATAGSGAVGPGGRAIALLNQAFHGGASNMMIWQRVTGSAGHGGLPGMVAILTVTGALLFAGGRLLWVRRVNAAAPSLKAAPRQGAAPEAATAEDRAFFIRRLAALDRLIADEKISPEEYESRRAAYRTRLRELLRAQVGRGA